MMSDKLEGALTYISEENARLYNHYSGMYDKQEGCYTTMNIYNNPDPHIHDRLLCLPGQ